MLIFVDGLATVESCFEVLHSGDVEDGVGECLASCHHVSAVGFCFVASGRVLREVGVDGRSSVVDVEQILAAVSVDVDAVAGLDIEDLGDISGDPDNSVSAEYDIVSSCLLQDIHTCKVS